MRPLKPTRLVMAIQSVLQSLARPHPIHRAHIRSEREDDLFHCTVCNGAESCLPTSCPGYKITYTQLDLITAGKIDFLNGLWKLKPAVLAEHVPESYANYDSKGAALLEASRDKQAYLQSLDKPQGD